VSSVSSGLNVHVIRICGLNPLLGGALVARRLDGQRRHDVRVDRKSSHSIVALTCEHGRPERLSRNGRGFQGADSVPSDWVSGSAL
jgi:hypothetical protein